MADDEFVNKEHPATTKSGGKQRMLAQTTHDQLIRVVISYNIMMEGSNRAPEVAVASLLAHFECEVVLVQATGVDK